MTEPVRLQRYLASAGVAARRKAEELITAGRVTVNGEIVRTLGTKVDPINDAVTVDGEAVAAHDMFYVVFNKPKACITAVTDDRGRPTVMEYLRNVPIPVKPVGRLDFYSEGVLLLTNDGELAARLLSPTNHVPKTYHVKVHARVTPEDIKLLRNGIRLDDGTVTMPAEVSTLPGDSKHTWLGITLHEGKNRQIHRMIEALGYQVDKLQRVAFANLTFHNLRIGDARELSQLEVNQLRDMVGLDHSVVARGTWRSDREETDIPRRARTKARAEAAEAAAESEVGGVHESDFEATDGGDQAPATREAGGRSAGYGARAPAGRSPQRGAGDAPSPRADGDRPARPAAGRGGVGYDRTGSRGARPTDGEGRGGRSDPRGGAPRGRTDERGGPARGGARPDRSGAPRTYRGGARSADAGGGFGDRAAARPGPSRGFGDRPSPARAERSDAGDRSSARGGFGDRSDGGDRPSRPAAARGGFGDRAGGSDRPSRPAAARGGFGDRAGGSDRPSRPTAARGGFDRAGGGERSSRPAAARGGFGDRAGGASRPASPRGGFGGRPGARTGDRPGGGRPSSTRGGGSGPRDRGAESGEPRIKKARWVPRPGAAGAAGAAAAPLRSEADRDDRRSKGQGRSAGKRAPQGGKPRRPR